MSEITKQDLNELGDAIRDAMIAGFEGVHETMQILDRRVDTIDMRLDALANQMDTFEEHIERSGNKQDQILNAIDNLAGHVETLTQEGAAQHHQNTRIDDRFERIEQHIGLPPFTESLRA